MKSVFSAATPETCGVRSKDVRSLLELFGSYHMNTHAVLMARGNDLFCETYYEPFHSDFLHRMYSVSKSFVAAAVGLAVTEGIISLHDRVADYFPEFHTENTDAYFKNCTILEMLTMRSNVSHSFPWWGKFPDRVTAYYSQTTDQVSGSLYFYDSIGSFLLGCIIEKLTGKNFLEYLKDKVLLSLGFSRESYVLTEPGGFAVGDSGVMCTAKDLLIFARLLLNKGAYEGVQYIDRSFMEQAVSKQSDNLTSGELLKFSTNGYGYLIWKTHDSGFSLLGMGDQIVICDEEKDFIFLILSDNQGDSAARPLIFHEFLHHFLPSVQENAILEDADAYSSLLQFLKSRKVPCVSGASTSDYVPLVHNQAYIAEANALLISRFQIDFERLVLEFIKDDVLYKIPFGIGENKEIDFSFGERPVRTEMGKTQMGTFHCLSSGAWTMDNVFTLKLQVVDTYFGQLNIQIGFVEKKASLRISKSGQYVFDGVSGSAIFNKI